MGAELGGTGVVDQAIEPSPPRFRHVHQRAAVRIVAHVRLHHLRFDAKGMALGFSAFGPSFVVGVVDDHMAAQLRKLAGASRPNAAR